MNDYAFYEAALTELYNSTLNKIYLEKAENFLAEAAKRFNNSENGGFYLSGLNNTELFINPKDTYDGAIPSGNSAMAYNLVRIYQITENDKYKELLEKQINFLSEKAREYPSGNSMFLIALMIYENLLPHITIVLKEPSDIKQMKENIPFLSNVSLTTESSPYPLLNNKTTFYVCKNHNCLPPVNTLEALC